VSDEKLREIEIEIQSIRRESEIALSEKEEKVQKLKGDLFGQLSQIEALSNGNAAKLLGAELETARIRKDSETALSEEKRKFGDPKEISLSSFTRSEHCPTKRTRSKTRAMTNYARLRSKNGT
jgi:hypothetical protein